MPVVREVSVSHARHFPSDEPVAWDQIEPGSSAMNLKTPGLGDRVVFALLFGPAFIL